MSEGVLDANGKPFLRFANDAGLSALGFLRGSGWPVFRMRFQMRMGRGLFKPCHIHVYSDLEFYYGPGTEIWQDEHAVGRRLEAYIRRHWPATRSPGHEFKEFFLHCRGTTCLADGISLSKFNLRQNELGLDFILGLIMEERVPADKITVITPYQANRKYISEMLKQPRYAPLAGMPDPATTDSMQGKENDIIVVIFGTTSRSGPGFTSVPSRLNVIFSRQRSGLVLVGDLNVLENLDGQREQDGQHRLHRGKADFLKQSLRSVRDERRVGEAQV